MSQFRKAFKGIDSAIKQGTARALNRALSSTKTKMVRALRQETGLKTDVIKSRTRARKAEINNLGVILGIAVKFGVGLSKFSAKAKSIKALYKDGTKRLRTGVTARIGKQARQLAPGAFMLNNGGVVGRKAAYSSDGAYVDSTTQGPLIGLKSEVFTESAKANESGMKRHLLDQFDKIAEHEIEFAIQKKFKDNK